MSHPLIWPRKHFFYPIGNTPAVCLTAGLAPEMKADILLLGCGDARNILYTIHADHGSINRPTDFTCCDYEPAILARNVILFTLLIDNEGTEITPMLWNIYYHFYLDQASLNFLFQQTQRLFAISVDLHSWNESRYGKHLKFCAEHSLSEIRRYWSLFLETKDMSTSDMDWFKNSFSRGMSKTRLRHSGMTVNTSLRCGGPLAPQLIKAGPAHFNFFWEKGVTAGSKHDASYINPTFAFSLVGKGFNVHYGTDPILGFHFAPILNAKQDRIRMEDLANSAKAQFNEWCSAFQKKVQMLSLDALKIRFFLGDALAFTNALSSCSMNRSVSTAIYTYPWSGTKVFFDEEQYGKDKGGPFNFDTINTSNLCDHIGILNIFLGAIPLLKKTPSSSLTTSFLLSSDGGNVKMLCCDISLFSLIFGVMPTPLWSGIASYSNTHEVLMTKVSGESRQLYEPVYWRRFPHSDTGCFAYALEIDAQGLARLIFQIYYEMFADENVLENLGKLSTGNIITLGSPIHYTRNTFAMLLRRIKSLVLCDWNRAMGAFFELVERDRQLLAGLNNYRDMCLFLHIHGVYSVIPLQSGTVTINLRLAQLDLFKTWADIPPVICIVLEIP